MINQSARTVNQVHCRPLSPLLATPFLHVLYLFERIVNNTLCLFSFQAFGEDICSKEERGRGVPVSRTIDLLTSNETTILGPRTILIELLGAYLGVQLRQVIGVRRLKVL